MLDASTRVSMTRQELVSHHLRSLALRVDPVYGQLKMLAADIDVHTTTLSAWIAQGYVPEFQVRKMLRRYGKKYVILDDLCPVEYRNA
jgi:hypothetical protein